MVRPVIAGRAMRFFLLRQRSSDEATILVRAPSMRLARDIASGAAIRFEEGDDEEEAGWYFAVQPDNTSVWFDEESSTIDEILANDEPGVVLVGGWTQ